MEKVCRWCKHYKNGKCFNNNIMSIYNTDDMDPLQLLSEDGKVEEAIRDGFTDYQFIEVQELLKSFNLSQKRIDEVMKTLATEVESAKNEWATEIDHSIVNSLDLHFYTGSNFIIKEPENFYCKEWE